MFVDEVKIELFAGNGGDGCTSFRREKFVPMGGPDGGSGGRGGNIIFEVDKNLKTLLDLKYHKIIKANKGSNGKGKNMHGKNADDIIIKIPPGTILYDENNNKIADLVTDKEKFIVAHGGRGGRGNAGAGKQHWTRTVIENKKFDKIIALCERNTNGDLKTYLRKNSIKPNENILVIIGPEGGFSEKEFELMRNKNLPMLSLGDLILKAETAVITAIGNIVYEFS